MRHIAQTGLIVVLVALAGSSPSLVQTASTSGLPSFVITFTGPEETVSFPTQYHLENTPDENISFIRSSGDIHLWVQGTPGSTYYFIGPGFDSLSPHQTFGGMAVPVLNPSGSGFDRDYAGSGGVMRAADGSDMLMFYHAEDNTCGEGNTNAGIGLARSSDGSTTWTRLGQIITSPEPLPACEDRRTGFMGAGTPAVVVNKDGQYIYMY